MSKRKNELKSKINTCFICGYRFNKLSEKHSHRINKNKGILENNIVVLCENCKKSLQNTGTTIYSIYIPKEIKERYFSNIDISQKQIIMRKIRYFRKKYEKTS